MTRRVRLTFSSDLEGLALPRSSLVLLPDLNLINDVCTFVRERFLEHVSDVTVRLELGGFAINADESAKIIRDEDPLTAVVIAANRTQHNETLEGSSSKKIERHRARREKQRESRKLSRKTKLSVKSNPKRSSGGVVIVTDSSNHDIPATMDSPKNLMSTEPITMPAEKQNTEKPTEQQNTEKPTAPTKSQQPQAFSRISLSTAAVKPLPRGHFRFAGTDGAVDAVPAESGAPLCTARDGKSVERAKRLGSFYFKSPLPTDNGQQNLVAVNREPSRNLSTTAQTSHPQKTDEHLERSSQAPKAEMSVCEPEKNDIAPKTPSPFSSRRDRDVNMSDTAPATPLQFSRRRDQVTDGTQFEGGSDTDNSGHDDDGHVAILETIATRGANFFAPRTLDRFGLKRDESQSEDSELQTLCGSLDSATDIGMLRTGFELAFRRLEIVNWAPQLSKFQKYRVLEVDESTQEVTLVTCDDAEEILKFQDMHDIKLFDADEAVTRKIRDQESIDTDLAAALQAKRQSMLNKIR